VSATEFSVTTHVLADKSTTIYLILNVFTLGLEKYVPLSPNRVYCSLYLVIFLVGSDTKAHTTLNSLISSTFPVSSVMGVEELGVETSSFT
jgi:hypothetical protein